VDGVCVVADEQLARFYSSMDGRDTFSGTRISSRILSGVNLAPQRGHGKMGVKLVGSPSWGSIGGSGLEHGVSFGLSILRISRKYLFLYLGLINYLLRTIVGSGVPGKLTTAMQLDMQVLRQSDPASNTDT
jgi:hypothetical protein